MIDNSGIDEETQKLIDTMPEHLSSALFKARKLFPIEWFGIGKWAYQDIRFVITEQGDSFPLIHKPVSRRNFQCSDAVATLVDHLPKEFKDYTWEVCRSGSDALHFTNTFTRHFFLRFQWGKERQSILIDGTPLFPYFNPKHTPYEVTNELLSGLSNPYILSFNDVLPLSALEDSGDLWYSSVFVSKPNMTVNNTGVGGDRFETPKGKPTHLTQDEIFIGYLFTSVRESGFKYGVGFNLDFSIVEPFLRKNREEFEQLQGYDVERTLIQEGLLTFDDQSEIQSVLARIDQKSVLTYERANDFTIFKRDRNHRGNYIKAVLLNYRKE